MEEEPEELEVQLLVDKFFSEDDLPLQTSEESDKLLIRMKIPKQLPKSDADLAAM